MESTSVSRLRGLAAPLRLARARIAARPGRGLLAALGVAAAVAMLAATAAGGRIASERALDRAIDRLPAGQRALTVTHAGPVEDYAAANSRARAALHGLAPGEPAASVLYRTLRLDHGIVLLGAVDDIGRYVRLTGGRLPRSCTPERCEVLQVDGAPLDETATKGARFVTVGTAVLRSALPFGSTANLGEAAGSRKPPPTLLAGDVSAMALMPGLTTSYRTFNWSEPLPSGIRSWEIVGLLDREAHTLSALETGDTNWVLSGPDQALVEARDSGQVAGRRMLLVGGEAAALLLGFTLLAAVGLRRDSAAERRRLERRGARASQLLVFSLADSGWVALVGVALGAAVGIMVAAFAAAAAGIDAWGLLRHSVLGTPGVVGLIVCWAVATVLLVAVQLVPSGARLGRAADLVALGALAALVLALARGGTNAGDLAGRSDPLLPALPLLAALVAGIAVARLLGWAMRSTERLARRGPMSLRLAALSLARDPGPAAITAGFLAVAFGLGILASSYRATLEGGQRDEAAYAVPADVIAREGAALVRPLDVAPLTEWRSLPGGPQALPVLRLPASTATGGASSGSVQVLGVPADALSSLRLSGDGFQPSAIAGRLAPAQPIATGGADIPAGPVSLPVTRHGAPVTLALIVEDAGGSVTSVPMGLVSGGESVLHGTVPRAGRLVAVELGLDEAGARAALHQGAEGGAFTSADGTLQLGDLTAAGVPVTDWQGWVGKGGVDAASGGAIGYSVNGVARTLFRAPQPTDGKTLPVLVSQNLADAAAGGSLGLSFGGRTVPAQVVGVADRFPTIAGDSFVVADESWLASALGSDDPGAGRPQELWLMTPDRGRSGDLQRALAQRPYDALAFASYDGTLDRLRTDPLARGILVALEAGAVLALVLALGGLLLSVASAVRDERAELFDLEAQGVAPRDLRTELRLRAALVGGAGLIAGLLVGGLLSQLAADLVQIAAGGGAPQPPLEPRAGWAPLLAGIVLFGLLAWAGIGVLTRVVFSRPLPRRPTGVAP